MRKSLSMDVHTHVRTFFDRDARWKGPTNPFDEVDPNIEFVEA